MINVWSLMETPLPMLRFSSFDGILQFTDHVKVKIILCVTLEHSIA